MKAWWAYHIDRVVRGTPWLGKPPAVEELSSGPGIGFNDTITPAQPGGSYWNRPTQPWKLHDLEVDMRAFISSNLGIIHIGHIE
jgi:hypothetical protein